MGSGRSNRDLSPAASDAPAYLDQATVHEEEDPLETAATRIEREEEIVRHAPPELARVEVIGGNDRGREHVIKPGDNSIGRGLENDIVLADIAVSRKHTLICNEGGAHVVRDLGSGNGTLVNGKRIDVHWLQDGDQIELGKTLLRYHSPASAQPQPPPPAQLAGLDTDMVRGRAPEPFRGAPGVPISPATPTDRGGPHAIRASRRLPIIGGLSPRARQILMFGGIGLVAFLGVMLGVKALIGKPKATVAAKPTVSPDEVVAQLYDEGTNQFRARNWAAARKHYEKVLEIAPNFDGARLYADQAKAELKASEALQRAKTAVAAKDYTTARSELAKIPSNSVYEPAARTLKQQVDDEQVQHLLGSAKSLKEYGDVKAALAKVEEARRIAPTSKAVNDMRAALTDDGSERSTRRSRPTSRRHPRTVAVRRRPPSPAPTPARTRPERVPAGAGGGLALYRKREWQQAYATLQRYAEGQRGRRQVKAKELAANVKKVGQAIVLAQRLQSQQPGRAMQYYKQALKSDQQVGRGVHQGFIKQQLYKVARTQANLALARKDYASAYAAIVIAKRYGQMDSGLRKVVKTLETNAEKLFTQGYTVRTRDPKKARRLWQQVLKMVPPSSAMYQKAYSWLNQSAPRYQDEDED